MTNHIHAIVCSPDTVGMPAPMRKMDPPAVILVITFVMTDSQHAYSTTVTCSEKPAKAGKNAGTTRRRTVSVTKSPAVARPHLLNTMPAVTLETARNHAANRL